jgi:hypothetical protein
MPGYKMLFIRSYYYSNSGMSNRLGDVLDSASSISYTPGHYLSSDAVLLQQVVSNNTDTLLKDLCTYGSSTNRYPAGDATMLSIAAGNEYQLTQLSQALFAEADAPTRSHALVQLAISMPDLYRELMSDLSIDTVSAI